MNISPEISYEILYEMSYPQEVIRNSTWNFSLEENAYGIWNEFHFVQIKVGNFNRQYNILQYWPHQFAKITLWCQPQFLKKSRDTYHDMGLHGPASREVFCQSPQWFLWIMKY